MTDTPTLSRPRARKARREIDAKLRARIEAAVEKLITALDALDAPEEDKEDGDADDPTRFEGQQSERMHMSLTPDDAEPALGWTTTTNQTAHQFHGGIDDREGPEDDREPSLCGVTASAYGDDRDLEDEHDGTEPCQEGEPWLGSFDRMTNQEYAYQQRDQWSQEGEVDPGHRKPTETQRERFRNRSYGSDPLTVAVGGRKVRAATVAFDRGCKPQQTYTVLLNGRTVKVTGAV